MKQTIDILQILLTDLGPFSALVAVVLAWVVLQVLKIVSLISKALWFSIQGARMVLVNPFNIRNGASVFLLGALIYLNGGTVSDALQYVEQAYINPTYTSIDTSFFAESVYEERLKRFTNEAQFLTVRDSTRALAKEIGCKPSDIYLVAFSECGLNPFTIRVDGIAAGWIQFTRVGLNGLGRSLEQVKQSCNDKDAVEIMRLTGAYIRRAANGRKIENAAEFYTAVFAPGKLGAGMDDVMYQGFGNPEYYLNAGLDGYFLESGKVLHLPHRKDGKLTKRDLEAALKYKEAILTGSGVSGPKAGLSHF